MTDRFVRFMDSRLMTRIVQVIAFASLLLSLAVGAKQYELASCLATYNNAQARANGPRIQAAEDDRQAMDELVNRIVTAKSRADSAAAFQDYVAKRRIANETRAKNPPPPPPSEVCR